MSKPSPRPGLHDRTPSNAKRRLIENPSSASVDELFRELRYEGYSKHKLHASEFGLEPYRGSRGDASLCDQHAGFRRADVARIPRLLDRAKQAALIGTYIWTVDDNGFIYEFMPTSEHVRHGYPIGSNDKVAKAVFQRFAAWAEAHGGRREQDAAEACARRYGFSV